MLMCGTLHVLKKIYKDEVKLNYLVNVNLCKFIAICNSLLAVGKRFNKLNNTTAITSPISHVKAAR